MISVRERVVPCVADGQQIREDRDAIHKCCLLSRDRPQRRADGAPGVLRGDPGILERVLVIRNRYALKRRRDDFAGSGYPRQEPLQCDAGDRVA